MRWGRGGGKKGRCGGRRRKRDKENAINAQYAVLIGAGDHCDGCDWYCC